MADRNTTTEAQPSDPPSDNTPDVTAPSSGAEDSTSSLLDALQEAAGPSSNPDDLESSDPPSPEAQTEAGVPAEEGENEGDAGGSSGEPEPKAQKADAESAPGGDPGDAGEDLPDEPDDAERKTWSTRTARRIEKLLTQRRELRDFAESVRPMTEFMRENDIAQEDMDVVLGLAAQLRKGDFAGFLRTVTPYVDLARQYVGEALPPDLHEQVQKGLVSEPVARELAARRARESVQQRQAQRAQQASQEQIRAMQGAAIRSAVETWERQTRSADPDFEVKADIVRRTAQAIMQERGAPQTPEQAVEYVREAYKEANAVVGRFRPAPKPTAPQPSSVHQASTTPKPEPKSMFDVVQHTVGGR